MRWLFALLLMTAAIAGCIDDEPTEAEDVGTVEWDYDPDANKTAEPVNDTVANTAPVASLTSGVFNATVPFELSLELNGTDADGDSLTWELSLGNETLANGTELPVIVNQTIERAGNHTFHLAVSDGNETTVVNFTFIGLQPLATPSQTVEGNIDGYSPACIDSSLYAAGMDGYVEVPVDPATIGLGYSYSFQSASVFDAFMILDAAGEALVYDVVGIHMPFDWSGSGTVPAGATTLVFAACDNSLAPLNGVGEGFSYTAE